MKNKDNIMGSTFSKEEMENIVKNSHTIKECLTKMNRPNGHGNYATFYRYKRVYNLNTTHFTNGNAKTGSASGTYKPLSEYTKEDVIAIKGSILLKKLIEEGYKKYKCEKCGISEWNGESIKLQVHHIDGNHYNNSLENLMILCPNCHSQTDSFCGRGVEKRDRKKHFCKNCGKEICRETKQELCVECSHIEQRKAEWPSKEDLENLLKENGFSSVGRMFGVSDNAVRKWCKHYGMPTSSKKYKNGSVA